MAEFLLAQPEPLQGPDTDPRIIGEGGEPIPFPGPGGGGGTGGGTTSIQDLLAGFTIDIDGEEEEGGGGGRRVPRRPTLNDALNEAGIAFAGQTWDSMNTGQRNGFMRFFAILDRQAVQDFKKGYRTLTAEQKAALADTMAQMGVTPEVLPEDLPGDAARKKDFEKAFTAQPKPLSAPPAAGAGRAAAGAAPAWSTISRFMNPSDVQSLTSAWRGGSLGMGAVNPVALRRYMALLPISATPYSFIVQLRNAWASSASSTRATAARAPSVRNVSAPRPVRFGRNVVASEQQTQPEVNTGLAGPPEGV